MLIVLFVSAFYVVMDSVVVPRCAATPGAYVFESRGVLTVNKNKSPVNLQSSDIASAAVLKPRNTGSLAEIFCKLILKKLILPLCN